MYSKMACKAIDVVLQNIFKEYNYMSSTASHSLWDLGDL